MAVNPLFSVPSLALLMEPDTLGKHRTKIGNNYQISEEMGVVLGYLQLANVSSFVVDD